MFKWFSTLFLACAIFLFAEENLFEINLKDPEYADGILTTDEGGVVTAEGLRIQARHLIYVNRLEKGELVQKIEAWGDLMVDFGGRVYVGDHFAYDFITSNGTILGARTVVGVWYIEGKRIDLCPKNNYVISDATVTTSETKKHLWDFRARQLNVENKYYVTTKTVQARVGEVPVFAIPYYRANLKSFWGDSPVRYKVVWDKGQGPRFTMRYRMYASESFDLYFRFDYRLRRGVGGAIETNYYAPSGQALFLTKNYLAHDSFFNDNDPNKIRTRYRLQGQLNAYTKDQKTQFFGNWDHISDRNLRGDFHMEDFELNIEQQTKFFLRDQAKYTLLNLMVKPKINSFDSLKQELPQLNLSMHPFSLKKVGIISENRVRAGYLDYTYANRVDDFVPDFSAWRLQAKHSLYRPFTSRFVTVTPSVGINGIFYNDNPESESAGQFIFLYDLEATSHLCKKTSEHFHLIEPYFQYHGLTRPTISSNDVFIFSIRDGYHQINQLRFGVRNVLFADTQPILPRFYLDLYAYGFFWDRTFSKTIPKLFTELEWNLPKIRTTALLGWNFQEQVLDVGNVCVAWTINEYFAISGEMRHRSRFYWRKNDYENYILDVARPIDELLDSPLSDGRNAALLTLQVQLAPKWTLRMQSHYGWGRGKEPGYAEAKIDLLGLISSSWRARLTYMHTVRDDRFTFGLSLVRK